MANQITIRRTVTSTFKLLRRPKSFEIKAIIEDTALFDVDNLIDWDDENVIEEDYSEGILEIEYDNKILYKE